MTVQHDDDDDRRTRASLVDEAEHAVRRWLVPGRFRPGDRLPTEEQLAGMLGISRGTLRSALRRLEATGEIVRRQGSGTFVAEPPAPAGAARPWLRTDGYVQRAANGPLSVAAISIEPGTVDAVAGTALGLERGASALHIRRVMRAGGRPVAVTDDVLHPDLRLPPLEVMRDELQRGATVHAMLIATSGIAFASSQTRIDALLVEPTDAFGRLLELRARSACLTLEVASTIGGRAIHYAWDVLAPGQVEIAVAQSADGGSPEPIVNRELAAAD